MRISWISVSANPRICNSFWFIGNSFATFLAECWLAVSMSLFLSSRGGIFNCYAGLRFDIERDPSISSDSLIDPNDSELPKSHKSHHATPNTMTVTLSMTSMTTKGSPRAYTQESTHNFSVTAPSRFTMSDEHTSDIIVVRKDSH